MEGTQWFGKIGTNQNDLAVAATISLAQALRRKNNVISSTLPTTWGAWFARKQETISNRVEAWWLMRRARQILIGELNDLEDLSIRNTDSLLEYPTLGETLKGLSHSSLSNRLSRETTNDLRAPAKLFYQLYGAERALGWWTSSSALAQLDDVIERARPRYDELLKTHASLLRLGTLDSRSARYRNLAYRVFLTAPAELRNYGYRLPVSLDKATLSRSMRKALARGPFLPIDTPDTDTARILCTIRGTEAPSRLTLAFSCPSQTAKNRVVEDSEISQVVNKLSEAIFSQDVQNGNPT
jgi:hypothetical protein